MTSFRRLTRVDIAAPGQEGVSVEGLRISFEVVKTDGPVLNTAKVQIYNAAETTIAAATRRDATIQLHAGYGDAAGLIFLGTVTRAYLERDGAERTLYIESGDGQAAVGKPVNLTLQGGSTIRDALGPLGAIAGQAIDASGLDLNAQLPSSRGVTLSGPVYGQVNRIARLNRWDWTVEDGRIVITKRGEATTLPALVISAQTGMVGAPGPGDAGKLAVKTLLNPLARLRRIVQLDAQDFAGWYLIRRIRHLGDSGWAPDYYTELELSLIRPPRRRP